MRQGRHPGHVPARDRRGGGQGQRRGRAGGHQPRLGARRLGDAPARGVLQFADIDRGARGRGHRRHDLGRHHGAAQPGERAGGVDPRAHAQALVGVSRFHDGSLSQPSPGAAEIRYFVARVGVRPTRRVGVPNDRTKPHLPWAGHDAGRHGAARGGGADLARPSPHHGRAFPARRADRCAGPHPLRAHGPGARPVDHRRERVGCGRHAGRRQGRARSGGRLHAQHRPDDVERVQRRGLQRAHTTCWPISSRSR